MYRKLKRTWSWGSSNYIPRFKEVFPELKGVNSEELADRFQELGLDFYTEILESVPVWKRFTLPFALVTMLVMLIGLPINLMFTGNWSYNLGEKNLILNWFRALKLLSY